VYCPGTVGIDFSVSVGYNYGELEEKPGGILEPKTGWYNGVTL
jgi:hypothetical protein